MSSTGPAPNHRLLSDTEHFESNPRQFDTYITSPPPDFVEQQAGPSAAQGYARVASRLRSGSQPVYYWRDYSKPAGQGWREARRPRSSSVSSGEASRSSASSSSECNATPETSSMASSQTRSDTQLNGSPTMADNGTGPGRALQSPSQSQQSSSTSISQTQHNPHGTFAAAGPSNSNGRPPNLRLHAPPFKPRKHVAKQTRHYQRPINGPVETPPAPTEFARRQDEMLYAPPPQNTSRYDINVQGPYPRSNYPPVHLQRPGRQPFGPDGRNRRIRAPDSNPVGLPTLDGNGGPPPPPYHSQFGAPGGQPQAAPMYASGYEFPNGNRFSDQMHPNPPPSTPISANHPHQAFSHPSGANAGGAVPHFEIQQQALPPTFGSFEQPFMNGTQQNYIPTDCAPGYYPTNYLQPELPQHGPFADGQLPGPPDHRHHGTPNGFPVLEPPAAGPVPMLQARSNMPPLGTPTPFIPFLGMGPNPNVIVGSPYSPNTRRLIPEGMIDPPVVPGTDEVSALFPEIPVNNRSESPDPGRDAERAAARMFYAQAARQVFPPPPPELRGRRPQEAQEEAACSLPLRITQSSYTEESDATSTSAVVRMPWNYGGHLYLAHDHQISRSSCGNDHVIIMPADRPFPGLGPGPALPSREQRIRENLHQARLQAALQRQALQTLRDAAQMNRLEGAQDSEVKRIKEEIRKEVASAGQTVEADEQTGTDAVPDDNTLNLKDDTAEAGASQDSTPTADNIATSIASLNLSSAISCTHIPVNPSSSSHNTHLLSPPPLPPQPNNTPTLTNSRPRAEFYEARQSCAGMEAVLVARFPNLSLDDGEGAVVERMGTVLEEMEGEVTEDIRLWVNDRAATIWEWSGERAADEGPDWGGGEQERSEIEEDGEDRIDASVMRAGIDIKGKGKMKEY